MKLAQDLLNTTLLVCSQTTNPVVAFYTEQVLDGPLSHKKWEEIGKVAMFHQAITARQASTAADDGRKLKEDSNDDKQVESADKEESLEQRSLFPAAYNNFDHVLQTLGLSPPKGYVPLALPSSTEATLQPAEGTSEEPFEFVAPELPAAAGRPADSKVFKKEEESLSEAHVFDLPNKIAVESVVFKPAKRRRIVKAEEPPNDYIVTTLVNEICVNVSSTETANKPSSSRNVVDNDEAMEASDAAVTTHRVSSLPVDLF